MQKFETIPFVLPIPKMSEIVKIDGDTLIDKDGNEFNKEIINFNKSFGGSWYLICDNKKPRTKPKTKGK